MLVTVGLENLAVAVSPRVTPRSAALLLVITALFGIPVPLKVIVGCGPQTPVGVNCASASPVGAKIANMTIVAKRTVRFRMNPPLGV